MAYTPNMSHCAVTRDGRKATPVKYDDRNWPAPWIFNVDGAGNHCYSVGGFVGNHWGDSDPLDLVGDWVTQDKSDIDLTDPVVVHLNMLRGTIAKPTVEQIIHLYGEDALMKAISKNYREM